MTAKEHYIFKHVGKEDRSSLSEIDNAILSINGADLGIKSLYIFNSKRELIHSTGSDPFILDNQKFIPGRSGFLDDRFTKFNVCHFLLDKLPRLGRIKDNNNIDQYILAISDGYYSEIFKIFDLNYLALIDKTDKSKYSFKFEKLILSNSSFSPHHIHPGQNMAQDTVNFIENFFKPLILKKISSKPLIQKNRKIFISRENAKSRKLINSIEIEKILKFYNFEIINLENIPVLEQYRIFFDAKITMGVHGAGLTNALFMDRGSRLLEILPPLCATNAYWKMAHALNFKYDAFIAEDPDYSRPNYQNWEHNPRLYNRRDIVIDPLKFTDFIEKNS